MLLIAHAASLFTVPTSTVTDFTSSVTDTLGDTGMLALIVAAIAIPLVFYVARRLIGIVPKGR